MLLALVAQGINVVVCVWFMGVKMLFLPSACNSPLKKAVVEEETAACHLGTVICTAITTTYNNIFGHVSKFNGFLKIMLIKTTPSLYDITLAG